MRKLEELTPLLAQSEKVIAIPPVFCQRHHFVIGGSRDLLTSMQLIISCIITMIEGKARSDFSIKNIRGEGASRLCRTEIPSCPNGMP
jgi:hypothetical protein